MKNRIKGVAIFVIIAGCLISAMYFITSGQGRVENPAATKTAGEVNAAPAEKAEIRKGHADREKQVRMKQVFTSNEEIRKEYGRLEIVTLFNGRSYTGAVISVDKFYNMATTDGTMKIPMEEVRLRTILK